MTGRVLFKESLMNSMVLTRLRSRALASLRVSNINYALTLSDLAFRYGLDAVLEITLWREERPHARYMGNDAVYDLFRPRGKQTLSAVLEGLDQSSWYPADTRVLLHFAKLVPVEGAPKKVLAPGSIHRPHNIESDEFRYPVAAVKDGKWVVEGVQLEGGDDVSDYVILAGQ